MGSDDYDEINDLRDALWVFLTHYKSVLIEHGLAIALLRNSTDQIAVEYGRSH